MQKDIIYISYFTDKERGKIPCLRQKKSWTRIQGFPLLIPVPFSHHMLSSAFNDSTSCKPSELQIKDKTNVYIIKILQVPCNKHTNKVYLLITVPPNSL